MNLKTPIFAAALCLSLASNGLLGQPATQPARVELPTPEALKSFKPTLVTLKLENTPILEALDQVGKQGNVSFTVWPDWSAKEVKDKKVSANFTSVPFWTAVSEICAQVGLTPKDVDFRNRRTISLTKRDARSVNPPVCVCGPVTVALESITYTRSRDYAKPAPIARAEVWFHYLLDPALESTDFGAEALLSEMVDDNGQSLLLQQAEAEHWTSGSFGHMIGSTLAHLQYLGQSSSKCRVLRGTIEGKFILATDTWELEPATAANQKHTVGKLELTITKCLLTKESCELAVNFKSSAIRLSDPALETANAVRYSLAAADGSLWNCSGSSGGGFASNLNYTVKFTPADKNTPVVPAKLIIRIPTQVTKCAVPFEFRDIPLP